MNYEDWSLIIGQTEEREWGGEKYQFRIGSEQQDADPIFRELQSNTPLRSFVEKASNDDVIRTLSFLSFYLINPTFRQANTELGANFFWFPLDRLNEERYNELFSEIDKEVDEEEEREEDEEEMEAKLPDFPTMSLVGEPIIEAAISERYVRVGGRKNLEERQDLLQQEIKDKQRELVEEIDEWLEGWMENETFLDDFSQFAEVMGRLPSLFLLASIQSEKDRIRAIHEVFDRMRISTDPDDGEGPELMLNKLNSLAESHPAFTSPAIEAFCLDEKNRQCEYHVTIHRPLELGRNLEQCGYCGSQLFRVFISGIDPIVKDAWMMGILPELVVARVLSKCDWVDEVIPRKLVQMETDEGPTSSVEVDVTVHTTDDEVFFFEVTTQRDKALERVNRKRRKFDKSGIDYDGIIQLSLADNPDFVEFGNRTIAAGAWMITGIETPEFEENLREKLAKSI